MKLDHIEDQLSSRIHATPALYHPIFSSVVDIQQTMRYLSQYSKIVPILSLFWGCSTTHDISPCVWRSGYAF